jgi:hypothetical protein
VLLGLIRGGGGSNLLHIPMISPIATYAANLRSCGSNARHPRAHVMLMGAICVSKIRILSVSHLFAATKSDQENRRCMRSTDDGCGILTTEKMIANFRNYY